MKIRIDQAARKLGWSASRTRDVWYADPRVSISAEELREIEARAGITYGREEANDVAKLIGRADALLARSETDSNRTLVAALSAFIRALDGSGAAR
ncbi:hypothetical protein [Rhizobium sp. Leaf384]|uniref:hypothetical protein n=1 Tax=Rhizobium sp. Leaf384 TaxID=1736358 RepID=UPI000AA5C0F2|nr:hypothetical protein [Rhizobium sp. Leaf384]